MDWRDGRRGLLIGTGWSCIRCFNPWTTSRLEVKGALQEDMNKIIRKFIMTMLRCAYTSEFIKDLDFEEKNTIPKLDSNN